MKGNISNTVEAGSGRSPVRSAPSSALAEIFRQGLRIRHKGRFERLVMRHCVEVLGAQECRAIEAEFRVEVHAKAAAKSST